MSCHGNVSHYHLENLTGSHNYNSHCYLKVDGNSELDNSTGYIYSPAVSIIGGLGATLESICGSFLNLIVILAVLKDSSLLKDYLSKPIVSLVATDLLFSILYLPLLAIKYFIGYDYNRIIGGCVI